MSLYIKREDIYLGTIKRIIPYKRVIDPNRGWLISEKEYNELLKTYQLIGPFVGTEEIVEENAVLIKVDRGDYFLNLRDTTFLNQFGIILDLYSLSKVLNIMPLNEEDLYVEKDTITQFYDQEEVLNLSKSTPFQLKREFEQKYDYWKKPL